QRIAVTVRSELVLVEPHNAEISVDSGHDIAPMLCHARSLWPQGPSPLRRWHYDRVPSQRPAHFKVTLTHTLKPHPASPDAANPPVRADATYAIHTYRSCRRPGSLV